MANEVAIRLLVDSSPLRGLSEDASRAFGDLGKGAKLSTEVMAALGKTVERNREIFQGTAEAIKANEEPLRRAAEAGQAMRRVFSENEAVLDRFQRTTGQLLEGIGEKFKETFQSKMPFSLEQGKVAFQSFQQTVGKGLEESFFVTFTGNMEKVRDRWEKFVDDLHKAFLQSLAKMASALVQENVFAPLFKLGEGALGAALKGVQNLLGLAEGGLVKKPTLALLGEGGPEAVLPLRAIEGVIRRGVESAFADRAVSEAATRSALEAGLELGIEETAAQAALAARAGAAAVALPFFEVFTEGVLRRPGLVRTTGDILFGERGPGLIQKGLGALGLPAFREGPTPEERGIANNALAASLIERVGEFLRSGLASEPSANDFPAGSHAELDALIARRLGPGALDLIRSAGPAGLSPAGAVRAFFGEDVIGRFDAALGRLLSGADAEGRFLRGPALRLLGEAGPEHVLNVDSPQSIRALQEGLRPILRDLFEEERPALGRGETHIHVDLRGAFFPDPRAVERLFRLLEDFRRGRRVVQAAGA